MTSGWDVVIIGAGIVGTSCALECAARGLRTAVIDPAGVGSGATAAGMGHIVVMDDSPAQLALTRWSQVLWRDLAAKLPPEAEYEARGTLWVATDEEDLAEVRRKQRGYAAAGVATEVLDSMALAEAEPELQRGLAGALLVPSDGIVYPPCAAEHLLLEASRLGAKMLEPQRVIAAKRGCVRLKNGGKLMTRHIVNACGAEATELMPELPIRKRRGHLVITDRYPGFVHHQLVELGYIRSAHSVTTDSVAFNVQPRQTGQLLIGSSREYGAEDATINYPLLQAMVQRAQMYLPAIRNLQAIRMWTGFRAATPDKLPLIGPWPDDDSLILATGHEGLGITTSLATGKLVAAALTGEKPVIVPEPYLPARFAQGLTATEVLRA